MPILGTDAYRFALSSELRNAHRSVSLVSAFITVAGIEWVLEHLAPSVTCLRVMARWHCADLVGGASDLEVCKILHARGAPFYILPDLHAKITLVDDKALLLGSANITNSGLRLVPGGNREIGISITPTLEDIQAVDALYAEAVEVSPDLYKEFLKYVEQLKEVTPPRMKPKWPAEILAKLIRGPERLWVAELLWCDSPSKLMSSIYEATSDVQAIQHDLALLGIDKYMSEQLSENDLRVGFLKSRVWQWLVTRLRDTADRELYFGALTSLLHDALLDDPKPYRQDVKSLVVNLVTWVAEVRQPSISVDRPRHSQRLRLHS
ncbi:MAG: phospholipase D-like domain-containing protein [Pyrinomonadaceae bacterium]